MVNLKGREVADSHYKGTAIVGYSSIMPLATISHIHMQMQEVVPY